MQDVANAIVKHANFFLKGQKSLLNSPWRNTYTKKNKMLLQQNYLINKHWLCSLTAANCIKY